MLIKKKKLISKVGSNKKKLENSKRKCGVASMAKIDLQCWSGYQLVSSMGPTFGNGPTFLWL